MDVWIEIFSPTNHDIETPVTSFMDVWIEILDTLTKLVRVFLVTSFMDVWIEI